MGILVSAHGRYQGGIVTRVQGRSTWNPPRVYISSPSHLFLQVPPAGASVHPPSGAHALHAEPGCLRAHQRPLSTRLQVRREPVNPCFFFRCPGAALVEGVGYLGHSPFSVQHALRGSASRGRGLILFLESVGPNFAPS